MCANDLTIRPPAWSRFQLGSFVCTVVSDGPITAGTVHTIFANADPAEVSAILTEHYLDPYTVVLQQNVLALDTGQGLVLFDTGLGSDPDLGLKGHGPQVGQTIHNLRAAGIETSDIDIVALTHAHPDHCWGLVDAEGKRLYPNARLAVTQKEYDFWSDLSSAASAGDETTADLFIGGHKNLTAYEDRLMIVEDGSEIVAGVRALATAGHSPGHVAYEITSQGKVMIVWGDVCWDSVLMLRRPDWTLEFDYDREAATVQRHRLYEYAVTHRYEVFAYHFPFPGRGHLRSAGSEYYWVPAELELNGAKP